MDIHARIHNFSMNVKKYWDAEMLLLNTCDDSERIENPEETEEEVESFDENETAVVELSPIVFRRQQHQPPLDHNIHYEALDNELRHYFEKGAAPAETNSKNKDGCAKKKQRLRNKAYLLKVGL